MLSHINDLAGKKLCHGESWRDPSLSRKQIPYLCQAHAPISCFWGILAGRFLFPRSYWILTKYQDSWHTFFSLYGLIKGLPRKFYHLHLPNHDAIIILVDETEKEYQVVYIAERTGLGGRWRGFSIEHRLLEQDALVFQLIEPDKLKVTFLNLFIFIPGLIIMKKVNYLSIGFNTTILLINVC